MSAPMRGRGLKARREHAGVTQTELAQMLGTHQTVISKIENNRPLSDNDRQRREEMDDLLPALPERVGGSLTPEEGLKVAEFIRRWAATQPENVARQIVAGDMVTRLRIDEPDPELVARLRATMSEAADDLDVDEHALAIARVVERSRKPDWTERILRDLIQDLSPSRRRKP